MATVEKASLGRLKLIARGGQGQVFGVPDFHLPGVASELVFKEYFAGQAPTSALRSVVGLRDRLDLPDRRRLDAHAAWPCALVSENGPICGILMPLIPPDYFDNRIKAGTGERKRMLRELQYLFIDPRRQMRLGVPMANLEVRLTVCRDLAVGLAMLHNMNLVFGDINAKNAVFRTQGSPTVMLVDCDAVRKVGQAGGVKQLNAPDWDPPEGGPLTQSTDRYKFGLFVLRCLTPGNFGSVNRSPDSVSAALDEPGRLLLKAAISADPKQRPGLDEWEQYFNDRLGRVPSSVVTPPAPIEQPRVRMRRDPVTRKWQRVE